MFAKLKEDMFPKAIKMYGVSIAASAVTLLVILSFPKYFFYVPFSNGINAFSIFGFTSMVGWVSLIVSPILFLRSTNGWKTPKATLFILLISIYTLSTVMVKVTSLFTYGRVWADYLISYPILFLIEWIIPIFYVAAAVALVKNSKRDSPSVGYSG